VKRAAIGVIAVLEAEQAPAIVGEQFEAPVQRRKLVQFQQHRKDAVLEAVSPGAQPAVRYQTLIKC